MVSADRKPRARRQLEQHRVAISSDPPPGAGTPICRRVPHLLERSPPLKVTAPVVTLVALCDILDCTPNDLIQPEVVNQQIRKTADGAASPDTGAGAPKPRRSVVRRPGQQ